jgi:hypothetical protein
VSASATPPAISIARDPTDPVADRAPVRWAIGQLRAALESRGALVDTVGGAAQGRGTSILVAGSESSVARAILGPGLSVPSVPEALGLVPGGSSEDPVTLACGWDERGLVYAVLELADRVEHGDDPARAVRLDGPVVEEPANAVRSVARCFASDVHDLPWFQDEGFWGRYLSMVVAQRFNRVNLMVGLGYNFPWHVTDAYLYFAYPFLVDVPGYGVRVPQVPGEERDRNLRMLRFASDEAAARGLEFQLALWTHAFEWMDSPDPRHTVEGLTADRHAAYCRDGLQRVLEACPAIGGLTLRTHGESGVPERSWDFWKTVLDGVVSSGRRVRIDLHAKGLDEQTLEIALATGLPITVSPKYAAEHMGLPYHQAAIRELDRPPADRQADRKGRFMLVSEGSRPFTRYSYGDFLREDRPYDVVFRIWPGTQRVLLWGDPAMAAGFGRHAGLAGSQGLEWCEPHSLRGREGTGGPGPRDGYADPSLSSEDDWGKHAYTYRLFGRLTYNPDAEPDTWRRSLRTTFGRAAEPAELALASASRILPLVTTAHHPSASNNYYWPEIYTDIGIVGPEEGVETHYYDTPVPKRFGTVGALDPEVFVGAEEFVREVAEGRRNGRHSPLEVAEWLERLSKEARENLESLSAGLPDPETPDVRRLITDVAIQESIGRFFAGKLRAAVWYEAFVLTGGREALAHALDAYRGARAAWVEAADHATGVYVDDLTYGPQAWLRGTWSDRLPAIGRDLEAMEATARAPAVPVDEAAAEVLQRALREAAEELPPGRVAHTPPRSFRRGVPVAVELEVIGEGSPGLAGVRLRFRPVDQSRTYEEVEMVREDDRFVAAVPTEATDSPFPLQYLFVCRDARGGVWRYPRLGTELSDRPYFLVSQIRESDV